MGATQTPSWVLRAAAAGRNGALGPGRGHVDAGSGIAQRAGALAAAANCSTDPLGREGTGDAWQAWLAR